MIPAGPPHADDPPICRSPGLAEGPVLPHRREGVIEISAREFFAGIVRDPERIFATLIATHRPHSIAVARIRASPRTDRLMVIIDIASPRHAVKREPGVERPQGYKYGLLASSAVLQSCMSLANAKTINNANVIVTTPTTYADDLFVATTGTDSLTIEDGETNSHPRYGDIGQYAGSNGTVLVTGAGSAWKSGGSITAGDAGTGPLVVQDGGIVNGRRLYVGYAATGSGTRHRERRQILHQRQQPPLYRLLWEWRADDRRRRFARRHRRPDRPGR